MNSLTFLSICEIYVLTFIYVKAHSIISASTRLLGSDGNLMLSKLDDIVEKMFKPSTNMLKTTGPKCDPYDIIECTNISLE